jgi:2-keto-3-deoxy-L-fuconate dehydrogenase
MKKVVVVTGGSEGIGEACIEIFTQQGYEVINLDIAKPQYAKPSYNNAWFIQTDVSKVNEIQAAFDKITQKYSHIDVLVSNAGIHVSATIENTDETLFDRIVSTNLKSTFFVVQSTLALMKGRGKVQKGGRIITIGSDQSFIGKSNSAAYGVTKAAIAQLTKNITVDYAKDGVVANCVCPGTIATPLYWKAIKKYCEASGRSLEAVHQEEGRLQPAGRVGEASEVASLIFYLANDAGSFIQGANIAIDGGYTAQ